MNNAKHEWCRDTARDEAVRAAEDAAAAKRTPLPDHRDLPSAVAELRERVARLEALVGQAAVAGVLDSVGVPPSPATRPGETTAKHPVPPADRLRTERVVLEIVYDPRFWHEPSTWAWKSVLKGRTKTVRVVEETRGERLPDMVAWITAERDAARAEAERLRDRVAELEAAAKTAALLAEMRESEWNVASELAAEANAENAGGEAKQEPEPPSSDEAIAHNATLDALAAARESLAAANCGIARLTAERAFFAGEAERLGLSLAACAVIADSNTPQSLARNRRVHADFDCPAVRSVVAAVEREIALRARVAELERAYSAECDTSAQAHRELSDLNDAIRARESGEERDGSYAAQCREAAAARDCADRMIPAPAAGGPEPRGWLTAEEREALWDYTGRGTRSHHSVAVVEALLARESPPRVRRPQLQDHLLPQAQRDRDDVWIAAIREAGGEVAE